MLRLSGAAGSLWALKPNVEDDGQVFELALAASSASGSSNSTGKQMVSFAAFTSNGKSLAVGCCSSAHSSGTTPVLLLHLADNRFAQVGRATAGCSALCTHPQASDRFVVGTSGGTLHAFQCGGTYAQTDLLRTHKSAVGALQYTRDAAFLMSASHDTVVLWDAKVCQITRPLM